MDSPSLSSSVQCYLHTHLKEAFYFQVGVTGMSEWWENPWHQKMKRRAFSLNGKGSLQNYGKKTETSFCYFRFDWTRSAGASTLLLHKGIFLVWLSAFLSKVNFYSVNIITMSRLFDTVAFLANIVLIAGFFFVCFYGSFPCAKSGNSRKILKIHWWVKVIWEIFIKVLIFF